MIHTKRSKPCRACPQRQEQNKQQIPWTHCHKGQRNASQRCKRAMVGWSSVRVWVGLVQGLKARHMISTFSVHKRTQRYTVYLYMNVHWLVVSNNIILKARHMISTFSVHKRTQRYCIFVHECTQVLVQST